MELVLKKVRKKDLPIFKSLSKSLGFEIEKEEKPYNPVFVKEILDAANEVRNGQGIKMTNTEINNY